MISTLIFDLDGTLVDTAPDLALAANLIRTARGLEPLPEAELRPFATRGATELLGAALGVEPTDPDFPALREEFLKNYAANFTVKSRPFPGIPALLEALRQGGATLAVATNKQAVFASAILRDLALAPYFESILSSDSPGCAMKPRPDTILRTLEALRADPATTIYVGDDPVDLEASRRAGVRAALVDWGYARIDLHALDADIVVSRPEELLRYLLSEGFGPAR